MKDIKAVFDIWNDSIKCVVFGNDWEKNMILAKYVEQTRWMRKWKFLDTEGFFNIVNAITEKIIKRLWWDFIDEVFVWISHPEMKIKRYKEQKRIMRDTIEQEDVNHLSKIVSEIAILDNYETIKLVPVYRLIDWDKKEKDPIWLQWDKLDIVVDAFMVPKNFYTTLVDVFDKVWLNIIDIIPNIVASWELIVDYDHRDLWTLLVDIWKNQTSYAIYEDWFAIKYWVIPIWWEDVVKDISIWMQIDIKDAEVLKKTYWTAINEKISSESEIDSEFLSEIIWARYEEIFIKINNILEDLWKDRKLPGGVLLIWWWSKVLNLDLLAKDVLKLAIFYWKDRQLNYWDISNNIQFINILWVFLWSNKYVEWRKTKFKIWFDFSIFAKIKDLIKKMI